MSLLVVFYVSPLAAHDPVFLSEEHSSPEVGPLLPNGNISFAMYGRLLSPTATQGFQAGMKSGDTLNLSLLIPAVFPETSFEVGSLPKVEVVRPDGTAYYLKPTIREMFHEPYTNTRYLRLGDHQETAQQGNYNFVVSAARPGRYVVSIGTLEQFGTEVIRYTRPLIVGRATQPIYEWFDDPVELDQMSDAVAEDVAGEAATEPLLKRDDSGIQNYGSSAIEEVEQAADEETCDCGRPRRWIVVACAVAALLVALVVLKAKSLRSDRYRNELSS